MALAKTTRPVVSRAIRRARLFRRLDAARARPVTWISGPAGIGKTTLAATYLSARRLRALWYQVDAGDVDVAGLFYYLGLAAPRRRRPLPLLTAEYQAGLSAFTRRFFRELYARLRPPFVIVFDNYQDAPAKAPLHEVMREALAEIPPGGRVIVLSRADPPRALARLRATRMMEVIDAGELKLTAPESRAIWHRLVPRAAGHQRGLHDMARGWAAGLVLLAEHAKAQSRVRHAPSGRTSEVLFDYFARELFTHMDADARSVLLHAAFLPGLTAAMAVAITGVPTAGDVLANLSRQSYFTTRHAGAEGAHSEPVYELHPLFRRFLLAEGERRLTPARRGAIQRAGARALEAADRAEDAASLLRDAKDWRALAKLVRDHARSLLAQGRNRTLDGWLRSLPEPLIAQDPWLSYWRAACRLGPAPREARQDCDQALAGFRASGDAAGAYLAWSSAVVSILYEAESARHFDRWIALLDDLQREFPKFPSEEIETRVASGMLSALTWRQPQHPDAPRWADRVFELSRRQQDPLARSHGFAWVMYHVQTGDFARAALMMPQLWELARLGESHPLAAVNALAPIVWMWVTGEEGSRRAALDGIELIRTTGILPEALHTFTLESAAMALSDGDLVAARRWLQEFAKDRARAGRAYLTWYHPYVTWEALLSGDVGRAASSARAALQCDTGRPLDEALGRLIAVQALHEAGERREARRNLAQTLALAETMRSPFIEFMARLLEAHIELEEGRDEAALTALRRAMMLGRQGGYSITYGWRPTVMARLCARALEAGIEVDYVDGLVRKRRLLLHPPSVEIEAWPWPVRVYTLGNFAVVRDDRPLTFTHKVQRRPLELLKALIAFGGRDVREDVLVDALWPEAEGDAAHRALTAALHRLRRLLGHNDALVRREGRVGINPSMVWVDAWAVERLLQRAHTERAIALYRGAFLAQEPDYAWAIPLRDRLARRLLHQLTAEAQAYVAQRQWEAAARRLEQALSIDPCAEDVARALIGAYKELGRTSDADRVYTALRGSLQAMRGAGPARETQDLWQSLRAG